MPQKKKSTQKHCRVPKSQIQTKKWRKVATSQKRVFLDCHA
jgi:hypothetical protein